MSKKLLTADTQVYSSDEVFTGKYWFGKKVYRKVVYFGTLPNPAHSGVKNVNHNITNLSSIVDLYGVAKDTTGVYMLLPYVNAWDNSASVNLVATSTNISVGTNSNYSTYTAYITLEYTKTTD